MTWIQKYESFFFKSMTLFKQTNNEKGKEMNMDESTIKKITKYEAWVNGGSVNYSGR